MKAKGKLADVDAPARLVVYAEEGGPGRTLMDLEGWNAAIPLYETTKNDSGTLDEE